MAFLDEDDALEPDEPGSSRRYASGGGARQRPYLARRLLALALGVLIIILLVLGVRGCLNARTERGFENYVQDLVAITTESQQLSAEFFKRLADPGDLSPLAFKAEIRADRSTAESLLQRVQGLDTPDELADEQSELELAFELRRDGIAGTADQISTALGNDPKDAIAAIAGYMRYFLASDVLYQRSRAGINAELSKQQITPQEALPDANFLPDGPIDWLDEAALTTTLAGLGAGGSIAPGVHGLALFETTINGTTLTPDTTNTISGGGPFELEVSAQNQGENDESDVPVTFTLSGGTNTIEGDDTISSIKAGATQSAKLNIQPDPDTGTDLTLEVTVGPVPGEVLADNNTSTYTVIFE